MQVFSLNNSVSLAPLSLFLRKRNWERQTLERSSTRRPALRYLPPGRGQELGSKDAEDLTRAVFRLHSVCFYVFSFSNLGSELNCHGNGVGLLLGYIFMTFSLNSMSLAVKGFASFWLRIALKGESIA